jgi:hypothetical protein
MLLFQSLVKFGGMLLTRCAVAVCHGLALAAA